MQLGRLVPRCPSERRGGARAAPGARPPDRCRDAPADARPPAACPPSRASRRRSTCRRSPTRRWTATPLRAADAPGELPVAGEIAAGAADAAGAGAGHRGADHDRRPDAARRRRGRPDRGGHRGWWRRSRPGCRHAAGAHVRAAGHDTAAGRASWSCPAALGPASVGGARLAGARRAWPSAARPRVAILSTGDELVAPGERARSGPDPRCQRRCARRRRSSRRAGAGDPDPRQRDDPAAIEAALRDAAARADLVVVSGGVSVGRHDHVRAVLERRGSLDFWRIARAARQAAGGRGAGGDARSSACPATRSARWSPSSCSSGRCSAPCSAWPATDGSASPRASTSAIAKDPSRRAYLRVVVRARRATAGGTRRRRAGVRAAAPAGRRQRAAGGARGRAAAERRSRRRTRRSCWSRWRHERRSHPTHLDDDGAPRMVDVGAQAGHRAPRRCAAPRSACAPRCSPRCSTPAARRATRFVTARLAGIAARQAHRRADPALPSAAARPGRRRADARPRRRDGRRSAPRPRHGAHRRRDGGADRRQRRRADAVRHGQGAAARHRHRARRAARRSRRPHRRLSAGRRAGRAGRRARGGRGHLLDPLGGGGAGGRVADRRSWPRCATPASSVGARAASSCPTTRRQIAATLAAAGRRRASARRDHRRHRPDARPTSPRQATRRVIDREVPGLAELMRAAGLASTPMAALSPRRRRRARPPPDRQPAGLAEGRARVAGGAAPRPAPRPRPARRGATTSRPVTLPGRLTAWQGAMEASIPFYPLIVVPGGVAIASSGAAPGGTWPSCAPGSRSTATTARCERIWGVGVFVHRPAAAPQRPRPGADARLHLLGLPGPAGHDRQLPHQRPGRDDPALAARRHRCGSSWSSFANLFIGLVLVALAYAAWRRIVTRPARLALSRDAFIILGIILGIVVTELLGDALRSSPEPDDPPRRGAILAGPLAWLLEPLGAEAAPPASGSSPGRTSASCWPSARTCRTASTCTSSPASRTSTSATSSRAARCARWTWRPSRRPARSRVRRQGRSRTSPGATCSTACRAPSAAAAWSSARRR